MSTPERSKWTAHECRLCLQRHSRHTFGSVAGDLGFSELTIAALLGHAARGVTQGYVHIDDALKLAASRTCEEIAGLLAGQESVPTEIAA